MDRVLQVGHSHLYPGARGRITGPGNGPCLVEFADGATAAGEIDGDSLRVAAYRTSAGTAIPERRWTIETDGDRFLVLRRAPAPGDGRAPAT